MSYKCLLHLHFITAFLNNCRQWNDNDFRSNSFCFGNDEPVVGICWKIFIINLHNLQMLFMLCIKNKFLECLSPFHKHEVPNGNISGDVLSKPADTGGIRGHFTPNLFCVPSNFVVFRKICFEPMIKTKIVPPKNVFFPPNLKTWLRAWFCQNCVCN